MKTVKQCAFLVLAMIAMSLLPSGSALAGHGHGGGHWHGHGGGHVHGSVGIFLGPSFGPYYPGFYGDPFFYGYPPPYYGYPAPVIVTPQQPPVYIEQAPQYQTDAPQSYSEQQQEYFWYHCKKPEGYYPYIKDCPAGWQKVTPEPPH